MGDGQHVWAAAEWLMMIRNLFVREEAGALIIGSGLRQEWLESGEAVSIEKTLTPAGAVSVRIEPHAPNELQLVMDANWRGAAPRLEVRVPGYIARPVSDRIFLLQKLNGNSAGAKDQSPG